MVGKSDLQTITGHVLVPYFPRASQYMIPKHARAECVKCTTVVLQEHLARTTRKSHARSNIPFSYGWGAARKLVARATCSISTTHFQTPRKYYRYVLYGRATANKSAKPVRAKTRKAGCKASFNHTSWMTVVTSTDHPKSVRNRCVIELFGEAMVMKYSVLRPRAGTF